MQADFEDGGHVADSSEQRGPHEEQTYAMLCYAMLAPLRVE